MQKKKLTTTKLLIVFLFINCTMIELFTMFTTLKSFKLAETTGMAVDFAPLLALLSTVVGEVISFAIYSLKSAKENSIGGIVYDTAMKELEGDNNV